jgi:hypothetical protein
VTQPVTIEVEVESNSVAIQVDAASVAINQDPVPSSIQIEADSDTVGIEVQSPSAEIATNSTETVLVVAIPGIQGPRGYPGTGARIYAELPDGAQDGTNTVFILAHQYQPGSVSVFVNGLREFPGMGYIESGPAQITMSYPPLSDDTISVDYLIA